MFPRAASVRPDANHVVVQDWEAFGQMMQELEAQNHVCVDYETNGLAWYKHARACGVGLGYLTSAGQPRTWYVPIRHQTAERQLGDTKVLGAVRELLAKAPKTIGHNLKFDDHIGRRDGVTIGGRYECTEILARLYDENRSAKLKLRAETDLGIVGASTLEADVNAEVMRLARDQRIGKKEYLARYGYSQVPVSLLGPYACYDVDFTLRLGAFYHAKGVPQSCPRIYETEMELVRVLTDVEEYGVPIDVPYLTDLREKVSVECWQLERAVADMLGARMFQLGSDAQMRTFLLDCGAQLWKKTRGGDWAVDDEVLEHFEPLTPALPLIRRWRTADKIRSTYTDSILSKLDAHGILHCDLRQMGANTGRLSAAKPNLQNQLTDNKDRAKANGGVDPWSVRRAYTARGRDRPRLFFDYSQVELRMLAFYSGDPIMREVYLSGQDIHTRTELEVFETSDGTNRRRSKMVNFGLAFCLTYKGFARQAKIPEPEAEAFMQRFFLRYSRIEPFRREFWFRCRANGGVFRNLFGRRRYVPKLLSAQRWERGRAERQAIGALIQGTAAELTKESMVRIDRFLRSQGLDARIVLTVHDEIQLDCAAQCIPEVSRGCKRLMEHYPEFSPIPIVVDGDYTTKSWADKKSLPLAA